MTNAYANSIRNGWNGFGRLILCLAMLYSTKSTACTTDSLHRLDPKPIRLTETGARQVLKDRADLIMLTGVVQSQDTLLSQQRKALDQQGLTIQQLNERQQQASDQATGWKSQAVHYQKKLRAARWENWLVRVGAVVYVVVRLKLI